jgi:hypothetical protein
MHTRLFLLVWLWSLTLPQLTPLHAQGTNGFINSFETTADLAKFTKNNTTVTLSTQGVTEGLRAAQVVFANVDWPNIYFRTNTGYTNADWRPWGGVAVDILNTNADTVTVDIRVDDDFSADGVNHCQTGNIGLLGGEAATVVMPFTNVIPPGMRGGPPLLPGALTMSVGGPALDWSHIVAFQVFLPKPGRQRTLFLDHLRLVPPPALTHFVDRYGQFNGADWPGKIHQDADFAAQNAEELQWLAAHPRPADRDAYGAWREGSWFPPTGFFRTAFLWNGQEVNPAAAPTNQGRWWLIAPSGRLFFSLGVDVINYGEATAVAGREDLFTWLPEAGDPLAQFSQPGANRTANFYGMNLYRKYGTDWRAAARTRALDRLEAWGFNTIGNWSQSDLFSLQRVPYTVSVGYTKTGLARFYPTDKEMIDVFDPAFPGRMATGISNAVTARSNDPWCLGYFVENELPWSGWGSSTRERYAAPLAVLADTNILPSKAELARQLQTKYASVADLNAAWNTSIASWSQVSNSAVALPATLTAACVADLSSFLSNFARVYFSVVSTNMKRFAPNQLYLGCRFASRPTEAVNVAAEYCDVVSFNIYTRAPDTNTWAFTRALNKPCLIGEFHFGALDRGMFHPGLVKARDQTDRGRAYQEYLRNVLALPAFVGCHWFQYDDEPLTGRFDGENYNIGFVSGADTPYWELIAAARQTNFGVYVPFAPTTNAGPVIHVQPSDQAALPGGNAVFTVDAWGWPPPSYHWRKEGLPLASTTGGTLLLTGVTTAHLGAYDVVVSNVAGVVTSAVARLDLLLNASLIATGAVWRYFDRTNDLGAAWRSNTFNDAAWNSGPAMLGFGDANGLLPATTIASNRQWTTYFRRTFFLPDPGQISSFTARLLRDDAAVVYLNGAEVWRDTNLPSGLITNLTPARAALSGAAESAWLTNTLPGAALTAGTNLLAVEVHQNSATSSDLAFDFGLTASLRFSASPMLLASVATGQVTLTWPADPGIFTLWSTTNLTPAVTWTRATNAPAFSNGSWRVLWPVAGGPGRYFRLQAQ